MAHQNEHGVLRRGNSASDRQRWLARSAFFAVFGSVAVLVVFAGLKTLGLFLVAVGGVAVTVAAFFWFLLHKGVFRWLCLGVAVVSPVVVLVFLVQARLLSVVLVAIGLLLVAGACARAALVGVRSGWVMPEHPASPPRHAVLVMNPDSGGGKVGEFGLQEKAEALGAEVILLDGRGTEDVAALARDAVARGADLLGVAGGDGTQALVAGVASEHDLPFLVISAGTRNHFALDLGLDVADPSNCLDALHDGVELRIDLGVMDGRTFVNNASFGAYAEVVKSPEYRDDKTGTILRTLPDVLRGHVGSRLVARIGDVVIEEPQAVLVSNGLYETRDLAGLGRRARLDRGTLGVIAISVRTATQAIGLIARTTERGLVRESGREVIVESDDPEIPVGIDGEAVMVPSPVRCSIAPGALRVLVPRNRPGVQPPKPAMDWILLRRLAWRG